MSGFTNVAEENYHYIKKLPIVHSLLKENKRLKRKNKDLKRLVKLITRNACMFSPTDNAHDCVSVSTSGSDVAPNVSYEINETVIVKSEPIIPDDNSDIEIVEAPRV